MLTCKGALVYCKEFPIFPSLGNEELFWVGGGAGQGGTGGRGNTHRPFCSSDLKMQKAIQMVLSQGAAHVQRQLTTFLVNSSTFRQLVERSQQVLMNPQALSQRLQQRPGFACGWAVKRKYASFVSISPIWGLNFWGECWFMWVIGNSRVGDYLVSELGHGWWRHHP